MLWYILLGLLTIISILIVILVLLQPHEGEGMGAVFGGGGGGDTFLGTKTITYLWKATIVLGILFTGLAIIMNVMGVPGQEEGGASSNLHPDREVVVDVQGTPGKQTFMNVSDRSS